MRTENNAGKLRKESKMKRFFVVLTVCLAAMALVVAACDKKKTEEAAQPAATEAKAPAAEDTPAEAKPAAEAAQPAAADAAKAADMAKAMAEATKNVDTSDAPAYMKKMVEHLRAINQVMKDNLDDCNKTVAAVKKYVEDNKAALEAIKKETEEAQKKMTDQEKMKMAQQIMALMGPMLQEMTQVQSQFGQKCAKEAAELAKAMQALK
jgi:hypothetical protein